MYHAAQGEVNTEDIHSLSRHNLLAVGAAGAVVTAATESRKTRSENEDVTPAAGVWHYSGVLYGGLWDREPLLSGPQPSSNGPTGASPTTAMVRPVQTLQN